MVIVSERTRYVLAARTRFTSVHEWPSLDSTNRWLLAEAARGAPEGTVAVADVQSAGRGRLGRAWEAPEGTSLLMSVLLRPQGLPPARRHLLTAATGLAAQAACVRVGGFKPELKWPNDLEVAGAKLAGILAQAEGAAVVVGIGCNVAWHPPGAASAEECAGQALDRGELLEALLVELEGYLRLPLDSLARAYREGCDTVGRAVRVELPGGRVLAGLAAGLDDEGRLLVRPRTAAGSAGTEAVAVGDVVHLRPDGGRRSP